MCGWRLKKQFREGQVLVIGFKCDGIYDATHSGMSEVMQDYMEKDYSSEQTHEEFVLKFENLLREHGGIKACLRLAPFFSVHNIMNVVTNMIKGKVADKNGCTAGILQGLLVEDAHAHHEVFVPISMSLLAVATCDVVANGWLEMAMMGLPRSRSPAAPEHLHLVANCKTFEKWFRRLLLKKRR